MAGAAVHAPNCVWSWANVSAVGAVPPLGGGNGFGPMPSALSRMPAGYDPAAPVGSTRLPAEPVVGGQIATRNVAAPAPEAGLLSWRSVTTWLLLRVPPVPYVALMNTP